MRGPLTGTPKNPCDMLSLAHLYYYYYHYYRHYSYYYYDYYCYYYYYYYCYYYCYYYTFHQPDCRRKSCDMPSLAHFGSQLSS